MRRTLPALLMLVTAAVLFPARGPGRFAEAAAAPETLRAAAEQHQLLMGSAVEARALALEPDYARTLADEYSLVEAENEMKFEAVHPRAGAYDFSRADAIVAFAESHGMKVRGHNLVWYHDLPRWITEPDSPWTPAQLNQVLSDHIATEVGHFRGKVYAWDVVNEPFNDDGTLRTSVWFDRPGIGFSGQGTRTIEQALRWAHAADPDAKLFVNEYGAEGLNAKSDAVYAMAKDFVRRGVPLSGIGLQLHVSPDFDSVEALGDLQDNVKRLAKLGLEVQFTEVDVRLPDNKGFSLSAQAHLYGDLLSICLRQPACTLFETWGFSDRHSWVPGNYRGYGWALPFDADYRRKRAYTVMLKKLKGRGDRGPRPR